jgi:hypothetical protein
MAPLPPPKQDHQGTLRRRAAMLASTAMARIGFGLSERAGGGHHASATEAPAISLAKVSLKIEDGLLMAFGPEGDPIPPVAFLPMAAEQPDAEIALADGSTAPAQRVAAVLDAQARGRLARQHGDRTGGEAWIKAMLGVGPQPVLAAAAELRGEDRTCELTIFGRELMLAIPGGWGFLIADAAPADQAAATVGLLLADGQALSVKDLVERLRMEAVQRPPGDAPAPDAEAGASHQAGVVHPFAEVVLPGCAIERTDDGLLLELPAVGTVRLANLDRDVPTGPRVSIVLRDGRAAGLADVTAALGGTEVMDHQEGPSAGVNGSPTRSQTAATSQTQPARALPVRMGVPRLDGVDADRVAVVIVRGVPAGGSLSAGIDDGDGRWVLSPRQLAGLTLTPPPGWSGAPTLEVTAVAVRNRAGDFATGTESVVLELEAPAETVVPLAIDPAVVRDGGRTLSALMIRGVPPGARLSAGTYDPATDGWVLRPDQLERLTVAAPIGLGAFTLTVLGVALAAGGRAEARVLTRLPVAPR